MIHHIIYPSTPPKTQFKGRAKPYELQPASEHYARHLHNARVLTFVAKRGNLLQRQRAMEELEIANRKMDHWSRHPNFDANVVARLIQSVKE